MRSCPNCARENPVERDFCECGDYLRWEPTGTFAAIPTGDVGIAPGALPAPVHSTARGTVPTTTLLQGAASADTGSDPAAITLRLPGGEQVRLGETLAIGADPGGHARLLALVRNQSGIVDNYELSVRGLPDDWWSIDPTTVYLVPFGTSGTYEQAVEVNLHPPRAPEAEARIWDLQIVAESKASGTQAAAARLTLGIQPYEAVKTKLEPERASGRRKARFDVAVTNTANAAVVVALDAEDPDGELDICFEPATLELPPGETLTSTMRVRPPRQKWIGRPEEKRLSMHTRTGEEAQQAHAETAKPGALDEDGGPADGLIGRFGATPPNERPGQNSVRARAPRAAEPRVPAANVNLAQLKVPRDGPPVPSAPLLPNQVVFRHKAWLPWWVATLTPFLMLVAVALYLLLPKGVVVPDVTGSKSAFAAEQKLTDADLKLAPTTRQKVSTQVPAGTILGQAPKAGATAEKSSEVTVLVAVGSRRAEVPRIVGLTSASADRVLRAAHLSLGQATPRPLDPGARIFLQIPAAGETARKGTPVDVFFKQAPPPRKPNGERRHTTAGPNAKTRNGGPVPAITMGTSVAVVAKQMAEKGVVPRIEKVFGFAAAPPGTLVATEPAAGTHLEAGDILTLLVSAGPTRLAVDDSEDIVVIDGASGRTVRRIATGPQVEKDPTFAPDGTRLAYTADRRILVRDLRTGRTVAQLADTDAGRVSDPSWAPTTDRNVLAVARWTSESESDLCFAEINGHSLVPRCKREPGTLITRSIHWAADGKSVFASARRDAEQQSGIMRWHSTEPFSTDPRDWSHGAFVTNVSKPDEGVIDAVISPDGTTMAVAAKFGTDAFRLYLTSPDDFQLAKAKPTPIRACKIAWRPDSRELTVVQADRWCAEEVGTLARLAPDDPSHLTPLRGGDDNPAYQPLSSSASERSRRP